MEIEGNMKEKSLAKSSIYNVAYKLLNVLFPLITATYVARILMASGVGKVSYAQNIVLYFTTIAALGIPIYGIREIAKVKGNEPMTDKLFSELFLINLVSTIFCTLAYYIMILSIPFFQNNQTLYVVVGFAIITNIINVDWFYQGVEEYAYIAWRSFVVKLLSLLCIFLFVRTSDDIVAYAMIYCLGIGGNNLFNVLNLRKHKVRLQFSSLKIIRHMKPILVMLGSVAAVELYTMVDTTMLGILCDDVSVGYYTNAMKLVKILIGVVTAIGGVLLPRLSYYHSVGKNEECSKIVSKVFAIMLFLFLPFEVGLLLVSEQVMPLLFGESFTPGIITLRIASLLICTLGFSNLFGTQVLLTFGAEKKLLICTIAGAVSNITINAILIPILEQNGAAVASVISETSVTVLAFIFSHKFIKISLDKRYLLSITVSTVGLIITGYTIQTLEISTLNKLVASVVIGGVFYIGINLILRNPIVRDVYLLLKRKQA